MFKIYFVCLLSYLLIVSLVRCKPDYLFNYEAGGWLKLHPIPATWQEAFLRCHYEGAVLASPLNKELANAFHTQMTQFGVKGQIFLGTHDLYSKGYFASVEGVPLSDMEIKWGSRGADTGDCFTLFSDGIEYDMSTSSCDDLLPFICFRKLNNLTTNECGTYDNEYHYKRYTGSCYKVHHKIQTWTRAYGICASEGGHLVILNDSEEARIVKDMFPAPKNELWECFHVGLRAWGEERTWTTIHGERFEEVFNDWCDSQPNNLKGIQDRACFERSGVGCLDDRAANELKAVFVCEKSPQSIQFEASSPVTEELIRL